MQLDSFFQPSHQNLVYELERAGFRQLESRVWEGVITDVAGGESLPVRRGSLARGLPPARRQAPSVSGASPPGCEPLPRQACLAQAATTGEAAHSAYPARAAANARPNRAAIACDTSVVPVTTAGRNGEVVVGLERFLLV